MCGCVCVCVSFLPLLKTSQVNLHSFHLVYDLIIYKNSNQHCSLFQVVAPTFYILQKIQVYIDTCQYTHDMLLCLCSIAISPTAVSVDVIVLFSIALSLCTVVYY